LSELYIVGNVKPTQAKTNLKLKVMQNKVLKLSLMLMVLFSLTSCEVIGGIFKAGMGVGIFIVIAVIAVIIFIISKLSGRK